MKNYEVRDTNIRSIVAFGIGLMVLLAVSLLLMFWLFGFLAERETQAPEISPLAEPRPLPPAPRLQVTPEPDLERLRRSEEIFLNSYGWGNREEGIVRIPIDRAIEVLSERGLPVRPGEEQRK